ncbi:SAC3/GANP/Nin1/mts3/eIF-3 p25 family-domain-containing protein [Paraphysoderma sedebokerense]|nr:SAC3/GANP/Nin1/mts3/eIF-3 p25 family-domain-containing protein [Paraphysoderma sedebokerense]
MPKTGLFRAKLQRPIEIINHEASLVERKNQRTLYEHIKQQIQKVGSSTQSIEAYNPIIRDFRKLREGVYASRLFDDFAVEVYEKSIEMSLLGQNFAELIKATTGLLDEVYPHLEKSIDKPPRNLAETTKYHLLYHICYINSPSGRSTSLRLYTSLPNHLQKSSHVDFAMKILMCVVRRDYVKFLKFYTSARKLDRIFLDAILPSFRDQTFKILRKAYYQIPLKFLHQTLFFNISCNANSEPVRNQQQKEQGEKASSVSKPQVTEGDNTVSAQEEESGSEKENVYDEVLSYLDDQGLNVNECVKNGVVYFKAIRK